MSKYTITIKNLVDNDFDFGLLNYPIFDENYRNILNSKIINHYYMNEIGFETAELFKFYLNNKMNEIMPIYNILYEKQESLLENFDNNVNLSENFTKSDSSNSNTTSNSTSTNTGLGKSKNVYQDTPQGSIVNSNIDNYDYATNINLGSNETSNSINDNTTSNGAINSTENYLKTIIGNNGKYYGFEIFNQIKTSLMNIDELIINELNDLFMGIF